MSRELQETGRFYALAVPLPSLLTETGLLARIGAVLSELDIAVQNARIATLGERAEDVFFVTDRLGNPVSDPQLCERLQQRLKEELNNRNWD